MVRSKEKETCKANRIVFDELLYLSSMLHDLGLVKEFDSHQVPFEEAGGHVAWVFGAGAGWSVERSRRAAQVIVHRGLAARMAANPLDR